MGGSESEGTSASRNARNPNKELHLAKIPRPRVYLPLRLRKVFDRVLILVGKFVGWLGGKLSVQHFKETHYLAIESGEVSWNFFEFQQLLASAQEHYGVNSVVTLSIKDRESYVQDLRRFLSSYKVQKYLWDPRTLSEHWARSWIQAFAVAFLFAQHQITPIAKLTDVQVRRWRSQTALITASQGVCISIMHPSRAMRWAVHRNLVGPAPMPLSLQWLESQSHSESGDGATFAGVGTVRFVGSLYEPRRSFLNELSERLAENSVQLEIFGRELSSRRLDVGTYLDLLRNSRIAVSTSRPSVLVGQDRIEEGHLVWRFFEAMAMGIPLVAEFVPGAEHLFESGVHYLSFSDLDEATLAVLEVVRDADLAAKLGKAGQQRVREICEHHSFWHIVDEAVIGSGGQGS